MILQEIKTRSDLNQQVDSYVICLVTKLGRVVHTSHRTSFTSLDNALHFAKDFYPNKAIWGHDSVQVEFFKDNKFVTRLSAL